MSILINGQSADSISVLDRGLQYGDGLFETMAVIDGACPFWDAHMRRLQKGCPRLQLPYRIVRFCRAKRMRSSSMKSVRC